jgi:DNA-binding HxlR family transcriptional regulator
MTKRAYGQFCGLVRALEIVGERWALLIVRDLLVAPKRFTDLRQGLPRIPTNILSLRLRELEAAGVVRRRVLPRPSGAVVYELTDHGNALEDVVLRLGRWGAKSLGEPGPEDIVTVDSLVMAMRSTFHPEACDTSCRWARSSSMCVSTAAASRLPRALGQTPISSLKPGLRSRR